MTKSQATEPPKYKLEQKMYKLRCQPRLLLNSGSANLGIRKFKKANRGRYDLIAVYKENAWKTGVAK